ncbi:MAG TPA: hypothetical protein PLG77_15355, partial [Burkholderiaceae bacterium]|nr:hypothetical protein [Burkholderiaceae bacterium]
MQFVGAEHDVQIGQDQAAVDDHDAGADHALDIFLARRGLAAIAFDRSAVVVDANIERVMARHRLIETPLPAAKKDVRAALAPLVPAERPGDFAQALMDLGAGICT